ncbi:MAG: hypothetical protein ACYC91_19065 [Solirubrobacteraceae bacterium]
MTVIRFKIGDGFPARDPVARFIAGLAMISNDLLRGLEDMLRLEGDTPEEIGRRASLFRRQAAAVQEAATFIDDGRRMFPEVSSFINGLDGNARAVCEHVIGAVDVKSPQYLGKWLGDHRNVTHHYPKMHPAAAQRHEEEMSNALADAADIDSTIDSGKRFGDARFRFADEVGVQLLPPLDAPSWMEQLRDTSMALANFAQRAAQAYLEARPDGTFTVDSHE